MLTYWNDIVRLQVVTRGATSAIE